MRKSRSELEETELKAETSIIEQLVSELTKHPESAVGLIKVLSKITKPWEVIGLNGQQLNEIPVPQGVTVQDFKKQATGPHISGYRLTTIFGDEVAVIIKDHPKWKVTIEGQNQSDSPFVSHSKKAEEGIKEFVETRLRDKGYILGK